MLNGIKQNIKKENGSYFLTLTVVDWIDIFTREIDKKTIIETLSYCIINKGLNVYAYCIMSNHIHNNPVKAGLVKRIEDWKYSSASNYMGETSVLKEVHCLAAPVETVG